MGERRYVTNDGARIMGGDALDTIEPVSRDYAIKVTSEYGGVVLALVPLSELEAMEKALAHVNKCIASNPIEAGKLLGSDYGSVGLGVTNAEGGEG